MCLDNFLKLEINFALKKKRKVLQVKKMQPVLQLEFMILTI